MTEERFEKLCFKANMHLQYMEPRTDYIIDCILCSVDFYEGILKVWVIPSDIHEGNETLSVHYDHIELPKQKLKAV